MCGICGRRNDTDVDFLLDSLISPANHYSTIAVCSSLNGRRGGREPRRGMLCSIRTRASEQGTVSPEKYWKTTQGGTSVKQVALAKCDERHYV
jgi:hypothetical protein